MGTVEGGVGRGEGGGGGEEEEVGATFSVVDTSRRAEDSVSATQRQSNKEQNISTHTHRDGGHNSMADTWKDGKEKTNRVG